MSPSGGDLLSTGRVAVVTTIPKEKAKAFTHRLSKVLSGDHDLAKVDMVDRLNRQLRGWAAFYKYTDFTATTFRHVDHVVFWKVDHVVFWKMAHWLARKYRSRIKPLMRSWYRAPVAGQAKTWFVHVVSERGHRVGKALHRLGIQSKGAVPMEKPGSKSLHLQGGAQEDHHLAISGCRNGHGPDLNGEPYALKGARTVRGGEALMRFLLHSRPGPASSTSPLSSTPMLEGSSAGGPRTRRMRASCSMRWSRHYMIDGGPS